MREARKRTLRTAAILLLLTAILVFYRFGAPLWVPIYYKVMGKRTVADVLGQYGPSARSRLAPHFAKAAVAFPPRQLAFLAFKDVKVLHVYADQSGRWVHIRDYAIVGASGGPGPKLREGDLQVPEGTYRLEGINPNSAFHLSLKVSYPNEFDRAMASKDGRENLGGDIFIHGSSASVGCLAMGDEAIEELFVLVEDTGIDNVKVLIAPTDFRVHPVAKTQSGPSWQSELYAELNTELGAYPVVAQ
ncbi:MAG: L,D-transpeptidase family protein [Candidatus Hydrogenedentes bacterium]|nr:L,D-transpeptidase family protein [Candidatus Hydrogenedentota bacterium]